MFESIETYELEESGLDRRRVLRRDTDDLIIASHQHPAMWLLIGQRLIGRKMKLYL